MRAPRVAQVIGFAMVLTAMTAARAHADPRRADRREGLRLYEAGRFAKRSRTSTGYSSGSNRDLEVRLKRGACFLQTNQPQKALADFDWVNSYSGHDRGSAPGRLQ